MRPAANFAPPSPPADLVQLGGSQRRRQIVTPARCNDFDMESGVSGQRRHAMSSDFWSQPDEESVEPQRGGIRRPGESQGGMLGARRRRGPRENTVSYSQELYPTVEQRSKRAVELDIRRRTRISGMRIDPSVEQRARRDGKAGMLHSKRGSTCRQSPLKLSCRGGAPWKIKLLGGFRLQVLKGLQVTLMGSVLVVDLLTPPPCSIFHGKHEEASQALSHLAGPTKA